MAAVPVTALLQLVHISRDMLDAWAELTGPGGVPLGGARQERAA
jgi:hypothetical protein